MRRSLVRKEMVQVAIYSPVFRQSVGMEMLELPARGPITHQRPSVIIASRA